MSVAAAVLLSYKGSEPVNVAWFFACTIGIQWLILAAALGVWLLGQTVSVFDDFHPLRNLLAALLWSMSAALNRFSGERREHLRARIAGIRRRSEMFHLLAWPLLMITQVFGVFFNLGVLAALLLPLGRDVAFGWQSTLRTSPAAVHKLVSWLATPWSFLPNAHPTSEEVVQSRFSYSEGMTALASPATTSWWPFLFYATLFYGFLVRVLLLIWCGAALRGALGRFSFDQISSNALFRRLTGPIVRANPETARLEIPAASPSPNHSTGGACLALVAKELEFPESEVETGLSQEFGWRLAKPLLPLKIDDPSGNETVLARIAREAPSLGGIAVLIGARRAPIRAIALVLQKVLKAAGNKIEVLVLLADKGTNAPAAWDAQEKIWRDFLAIHGLHAGLERWR
jgi:hypothetical protein